VGQFACTIDWHDLGLDSGYNGTVLFKVRWYDEAEEHYISQSIYVTVDTSGCTP
jgi:hypothetical protein